MTVPWALICGEDPGVVFSFGSLFVAFSCAGEVSAVAVLYGKRFRVVTRADRKRIRRNGKADKRRIKRNGK